MVERLLLGLAVPHCCGEDERDPLVLRHAGRVSFPLDQRLHVRGKANSLDSGLAFGHGQDRSAPGSERVLAYALANKWTGEVAASRSVTPGGWS